MSENPINDQLSMFQSRIRQVSRKHRTACAIDGPPGIGKGYSLRLVANEEGIKFRTLNGTTAGLSQSIYQYRDTPVLVMDDFDLVLRSKPMATLFKDACAIQYDDPASRNRKVLPRTITNDTKEAITNANRPVEKRDMKLAPPKFTISCGFVMMTNEDIARACTIDKGMVEHVAALKSRGLDFIHLSREREHLLDYVVTVATTTERSRFQGGLTTSEYSEVLKFLEDNADRFEELSFRKIDEMVQDYCTLPPGSWKEHQKINFLVGV